MPTSKSDMGLSLSQENAFITCGLGGQRDGLLMDNWEFCWWLAGLHRQLWAQQTHPWWIWNQMTASSWSIWTYIIMRSGFAFWCSKKDQSRPCMHRLTEPNLCLVTDALVKLDGHAISEQVLPWWDLHQPARTCIHARHQGLHAQSRLAYSLHAIR